MLAVWWIGGRRVANRRVSIWTYKKVDGKWRYSKPLVGKNNKIKPEPGAAYYIRFREGAKLVWRKCRNAADATIARERQEVYLAAHAHGLTDAQQAKPVPKMVSHALDGWLEEYRLSHSKESYNLMKQTLHEFFGYWDEQGRRIRGFVSMNLIEQVRRVDLLRYRAYCIETVKNKARTAANKMLRVNQFIRSILELPEGKGRVTVKDGKFVEMEPTVFNEDELKAFFGQCDAFRFAVFKTYLMAGLRKAELENLEWSDVDFNVGTIAVSPKVDFTPKDYEQRSIEVPDELLNILKELPRRGTLVFANSEGHKYTHSWDDARKIANKAKVTDCHPHRFRATYATRLLQNGIDLKTVQKLLGHKNLESTMRYLAKAESPKVRAKVNAVKFGA
jgi:integrase/recombinase XerD